MENKTHQQIPVIEFRNVAKSFGSKVILDGISFRVFKGRTFCLIGGSGTGKSVALKLLLGLMSYDSGAILYKGCEVAGMTPAELKAMRYEIGMVFQGSALFDSLTVEENVAYPLFEQRRCCNEDEARPVVHQKLRLVGLEGIDHHLPADLSGGMKKRVGVARALATDPEVILYDEPTAGLDPTNVNRVDDIIEDLKKKLHVTSIVVTHHMASVFRIADEVALLYDKKVQFMGSVKDLMEARSDFVRKFIEGRIGEE